MYVNQVIRLGIPLLAGNLSHYLLQVADTAMVGRLGTKPLGAIAMAGLFTGILFTFVFPVSLGTQALASRRFGRQSLAGNDREAVEKTGEVLDNGIMIGMIAAVMSVLFSFLAGPILGALITDPDLLPQAMSYIRIIRWAMPFAALSFAFVGFFGGINKTGDIMISNIGGNILNISFNYIFIFGKLGFPALGIRGAALGTLLASSAQLLYLYARAFNPDRRKMYNYLHFRGISGRMLKDMARTALPVAIQNVIALAVFLVFEAMIGFIGTVYLAATHIIFSIFRINKTIIGGFARAGAILVGNSLGAGEPEKSVRIIQSCQIIASVFATLIVVSAYIWTEPLVGLFTGDPSTLTEGIRALTFFAPFFFIEVLGYSFETIFTGNGWGRFVLISEFTTNIVFILLSTFICTIVIGWGIYSAWISFALYQIFHALILTGGYLSRRWMTVEIE